jgi:hypothetical protein
MSRNGRDRRLDLALFAALERMRAAPPVAS